MLVQQILKEKSADGVITIKPGSSVEDAASLLSNKRIGSVVVSADGKSAAGILSERDIVRELGKRGTACMVDKVDDLMTKNLQTCACEDRAETVLSRMTEGRFRHMPVIKGGEMVGIVTLGDVVKAQLTHLEHEKEALEGMIKGF